MAGIEGLLHGRVLADRYRIEEVIGRGGMGAVYRSVDERLGRQVAVKVITVSGGSDPGARERLRARFLREARSAAALPHHPNVVPVYDYGTDPELGLDFLVMELLRGEDLATRLARSGPPPLPTGIWILHEAARGVAVGHRAGLVHRDVKPGNIFLARGNHPGDVEVRILDFGIAKLAAEEDTSNLTQDGRVPLSPAYAAPEQLRGLNQLSPAADVFSLGAVGFQLLTSERPFTDADRNRMSIGMPVPVPSLRALNPAIPPAVEEIVQRALAYDPQERWADAGAVASVLEQARREMADAPLPPYAPAAAAELVPDTGADARTSAAHADRTEFLDDRTLLDPSVTGGTAREASATAPRPARERTPPPERERRSRSGWLVTALVALILLGAGGVFALWLMDEQPQPVAEVIEPAAPAPEIPDIPIDQSLEPTAQGTELDALANNLEGRRFYQAGDFPTALAQFERALSIAPDNPEYRNNYAWTLFKLGQIEEAARQLERVIRLDPNRAIAYANIADARAAMGDTTSAIEALERFLQLSTNPRERGIAERRLREWQAAQQQPLPVPDSVPVPDTPSVPSDTAGSVPTPP